MKPFLYRGRALNRNAWLIDNAITDGDYVYICTAPDNGTFWWRQKVRPETLSVRTRKSDMDGYAIHENDVVVNALNNEFGLVEWDENAGRFIVRYRHHVDGFDTVDFKNLYIYDNVFDNPNCIYWYKFEEARKKVKPVLFRAETLSGGWTEGYPVELSGHTYLYFCCFDSVLTHQEVYPETLCAYTGQLARDGEPICENDVVFDVFSENIGVVEWDEPNSRFLVRWRDSLHGRVEGFDVITPNDLRIIGNIFDDPDLVPWYKQ